MGYYLTNDSDILEEIIAYPGQNPYVALDANGNVTDLLQVSGSSPQPSIVAHYEYSPYGDVTSSTGAEAGNNKIRFSTKYWDDETGLGYWGYRYYSTSMGRWMSRDPLAEEGGVNLHSYVDNSPVDAVDPFGDLGLTAMHVDAAKFNGSGGYSIPSQLSLFLPC